jgi:hypothetical protein
LAQPKYEQFCNPFFYKEKNTSDFSHLENKDLMTIHSCLNFKLNYRRGKKLPICFCKAEEDKECKLGNFLLPPHS